jgi:hypothetical protein
MDETENHVKLNEQDSERQMLGVFSCMWNLGGGDMKVKRETIRKEEGN